MALGRLLSARLQADGLRHQLSSVQSRSDKMTQDISQWKSSKFDSDASAMLDEVTALKESVLLHQKKVAKLEALLAKAEKDASVWQELAEAAQAEHSALKRQQSEARAPQAADELAAARAQLQRVQGELERATDELARSQQHSAELQQQLEANLMSNSHKSSDAELLRSKLAVADGQVETNMQNRIWQPLGCALHCAACAQHCGLAGSQRQRAAD